MRWRETNVARHLPLVVSFLFPATLVVLFLLEVWDVVRSGSAPPVWQLAVGLGAMVVLVLRDLFPRTILAVQLAVAVAAAFTGMPLMAVYLGCLVALCNAVACSEIGQAITVTTAALGLWLVLALVADGRLPVAHVVLGALAVLAAAAAGWARRCAVRRSRQLGQAVRLLDQTRGVLADQALLVERSRIVWEFHDIVAHGLALIAVRAGVARALMSVDVEHANEAILVIENAARESLGDMRRMVRVLRTPEADHVDDRPQPGLWQLDELVETTRSAGLQVDVVHHGTPRPLPAGQELTAYRVVQEALTNVRKHAGATRATVTLRYLPGKLVIDVFNEASRPQSVPVTVPVTAGAPSVPEQCGHGLISMRERVGLYGGSLLAGEVGGGFGVTAEIPLRVG